MRGNARKATRAGAYVASAALAISGTILAVSPADAVTYDPAPANKAGDWLSDELAGGSFTGDFSQGLSIDAALALVTIGGHSPAVTGVRNAMASQMTSYVSPQEGTPPTTTTAHYANALAKATVFAQQVGADPKSYGGHNLVTELAARVRTTGPATGRIVDDSIYGDYANTLGQAYAAHALATASSGEAASVTSFLLKQQCSSGYFRQQFSSIASPKQSCVNGVDKADPDATAIAVQQLASQASVPVVGAAVARAKSWLKTQQRCDGSFGGGTGTEESNANSTGLAAWALGDSPAARQAATWLRAHQATSVDAGNALATQTGAMAYDGAGLAAGRRNGITSATRDQWRRATAQGAPGLVWFSNDRTPALDLTARSGYLKARTRAVLTTTGATAGTVLCVTGTGASARGVATANGWSTAVTLPAGTATRSYRVRDAYGHVDTQALKVLGAKKLSVGRSKFRVKRSRQVTATISGLAPGEAARIYYKGKLVRSGHATAAGRFVASFKVGRQRGQQKITGYGQFADIRRGTAVVEVVR